MALATIVSVRGSTYRRPGARLLVPDEGEAIGNLSGGCLEGQVIEIARSVMESGECRLELYDLTADDEIVWGWGLGCNGAIEVFVEPAANAVDSAAALREAITGERLLAAATVIESSMEGAVPGARMLVYPGGPRRGSLGDDLLTEAAAGAVHESLTSGVTEVVELDLAGGGARVFIESLRPPLRLVVCGAGHDAVPLVRAAAALGWRVDVVDDRSSFLDAGRFPGVRNFIKCEPGEIAERAGIDERSHVVVMSHNYLRDRDYLRSLLPSRAAYIGMLGPRARLQRLLDDLGGRGVKPTEEQLDRVHGPAGVDLGGEGPEEIAAAIVAEVLAVSRGRDAGFLRQRAGPIHQRSQPATA
ncbi:MAG: XdhC family protein [Actinobacteria bacterium]|nr:XdhC family protein [Actinomycetota bacterium]